MRPTRPPVHLSFAALFSAPSPCTRPAWRTARLIASAAATLENLILRPDLYELLTRIEPDGEVLEVTVRSPRIVGRPLRTLRLPEDCRILLVWRDNQVIIPWGGTILESGDILALAGDAETLEGVRKRFEGR